jgi:hypothetical protein
MDPLSKIKCTFILYFERITRLVLDSSTVVWGLYVLDDFEREKKMKRTPRKELDEEGEKNEENKEKGEDKGRRRRGEKMP